MKDHSYKNIFLKSANKGEFAILSLGKNSRFLTKD